MGATLATCCGCSDKPDPINPAIRPELQAKRDSSKVVIIGAGPAGIHMASLLIKAGWPSSHISILEKSDRISGKSYSVNDSGLGPNDTLQLVHEMGTCYCHADYQVIFDLFAEYEPNSLNEVDLTRHIFGTQLNKQQRHVELNDWLLAEMEEAAVPKSLHFINDKITGGLAFADAVLRYCNVYREIFGDEIRAERYGMPERPVSPQASERINCTFLEFIQNEGVEALVPVFVYCHTTQGYGPLDKIPAYYGLYWNNPQFVTSPVWTAISGEPAVSMANQGFQQLWRKIATKHKLNVIKNAQVLSVNRYLADESKKTKICYNIAKADDYLKHPDDADLELKQDNQCKDGEEDEKAGKDNGQMLQIECDYLFVACGCKNALSFLDDATEQETEIFGALKSQTFCTTLWESSTDESQSHERVAELWPGIVWAANGHVGSTRNTIKCWLGHDKYDELVKKGEITKDRSVAYQFEMREPNKDRKVDEVYFREKLEKDLTERGEKDIRIIFQTVWDYFTIWDLEDINKGYPWIVRDDMQGKNKNTYYLGQSVSFESVLSVVEYNYRVFDQYFGVSSPKKVI